MDEPMSSAPPRPGHTLAAEADAVLPAEPTPAGGQACGTELRPPAQPVLPAPATEPARAPAAPHVPAASDPVDESGRPEQSGFGGEPAAEQGERQLGATEREPGELTAPLGISRTPTQNPEVDAGLDRLGGLDHLPIDGHLEVYEDVHQGLRDVLDALDQRPGPGPRVPAPSPHHHRS